MRTTRRTAILLAVTTALGLASGCVSGDEDPMWDDDEELGTSASELVIPSGMVGFSMYESSAHIVNPERGYYTGYDLLGGRDASTVRSAGYTLALALVNMKDYRYSSLPSAFLDQLRAGFGRVRAGGIKVVLRFNYNAGGSDGADASKARILQHLEQLKPLLRDNADVIAVVQAGFIGRHGEWHGSTNGLDSVSAQNEIVAALLGAVPSSRSVQLRKPEFKNNFRAGAVSSTEAFTGTSRSRLGHHNDCFLASTTDLGTYPSSSLETWKTYTATDTLYTPMGGETCIDYEPRTSCTTALAELSRMHWSYLNRKYNLDVFDRWIEEGCESTIRRKLGYRFVLSRVAHTPRVAPGGVLGLELDIKNRGYAIPMNQRPIYVVLTRGSTKVKAKLAIEARRLPAGQTTTVRAKLRVGANLPVGTYTISLELPDASSRLASDARYAIQFANDNVWDATTGENVLTRSFKVDASAGATMGYSLDSYARNLTLVP